MNNIISKDTLKQVCHMGQGDKCWRYITLGRDGFECAKHTSLKPVLDKKVEEQGMVAMGDNCAGLV